MEPTKPHPPKSVDNDISKGTVEQDRPDQVNRNTMRGQLGHRTANKMIKASDSDFPEPGSNPEHSGEQGGENQGDEKE